MTRGDQKAYTSELHVQEALRYMAAQVIQYRPPDGEWTKDADLSLPKAGSGPRSQNLFYPEILQ